MKQQPRDADRLSAYSDAVFAVIVTIMVLQLSAPHSPHLSALIKLWQPAVSYLVSYVFIAIIWINHHYLSRLTRATTLPIIWINFVHLFFVSLLPFTTAWIAQTRLAAIPVVMYAALFVCADGTYNVFERRVLRESDEVTDQQRRMARYRSLVAFALFTSAAVLAGFVPWAGFGLICLALVLHLKPDIGVRRRRRYYRERCCQGSCAARARQSRPADRADGPAMRLSRRIDPAHLTVQGVLNSYTCCRSPSRSGMTGRNSARSPGSGGKEDDAAVGPGGLRERDPPAAAPRHGARCRNFGLRGDSAGRQRGERRGQPIGAALGGGVSGVRWVVDAYMLVFATLILLAGALGDRSGHKRLLMAGFAVFTPASVACGLVPAIGELVAVRPVQGAGAAALGASSLSLINHTYPDAAGRARAVSVWTAGGAATLAAGPLIGGLLIAAVGWRSIFFINLPLGALGWWLTRRYATTTPADPGRGTDLPGQVTAIIALTALAGSTIEAGSA
ncbi:MFS transporter, partial [Trebonia sp.]|uniref:MFS transporter n=1 Tax=Trebonia sp. TaxID=2767075 RepID=UPI003BB1D28C